MAEKNTNIYDEAYEDVKNKSCEYMKFKGSGVYTLTIVSELEHVEKTFPGDEKPSRLGRLMVDYNKSIFAWEFGCGGRSSLYGQLTYLGKHHRKLNGLKITVIVNSDGRRNNYSIKEYLDLINNPDNFGS